MQRFGTVVILVGLLAGLLVGCDGSARIPPGAQQVHVVATDTEVRMDPPTVHAGDVYLVLDEECPPEWWGLSEAPDLR